MEGLTGGRSAIWERGTLLYLQESLLSPTGLCCPRYHIGCIPTIRLISSYNRNSTVSFFFECPKRHCVEMKYIEHTTKTKLVDADSVCKKLHIQREFQHKSDFQLPLKTNALTQYTSECASYI